MKYAVVFALLTLLGCAAILAQTGSGQVSKKEITVPATTSNEISVAVEKGAKWRALVQGGDGGVGGARTAAGGRTGAQPRTSGRMRTLNRKEMTLRTLRWRHSRFCEPAIDTVRMSNAQLTSF